MSELIVQQLTDEITAYVQKGAGAAFRDKAKHEAHTFSVSHSSIKNSITIAVNKAIGTRAKKKIKENQDIKNDLDNLIDQAANLTINNIKGFFNVTDTAQDFQVTINQVTGIDALKGGYSIDGRYSKTEETIYDNIRNSFNYLKRQEGFIGELNKFLQDKGVRKKDIKSLNLVVGHVVSVTERRTRESAGRIKKIIEASGGKIKKIVGGKEVGITWKDFIALFSNPDRVILRKLTSGPYEFTWEVSIEDGITNNPNKKLIQELGIVEARLYGVYKKILDKIPQKFEDKFIMSEGSDNLSTVIKKSILNKAKNNLKKDKRVKATFKEDTKIKYPNGKPKRAYTKKYKPKKGRTKITKVKPPAFSIPNIAQVDSSINLNALKAEINARLSMTVIKNMGTPALENRTGRFAGSAQVTDIIQTPKGFPSIGYTYQKYPYQTFEPGFAQGSTQRDPRVVISKSIREIAKDLIVGRFYTRRT